MSYFLVLFFAILSIHSFSYGGEVKVNPLTRDLPPLRESSAGVAIAELANLDNVITVTKVNLQNQVKLRDELALYKDLYNRYMENTADRELLYKVVIAASHAQKTLLENHLQHVFSKDFLKELSLFANVAEQRAVPRP